MWKLACISAWTPTPYGKLACGDGLSEAAAGQSILMLPKQSSTLHRHCVRCRTARFSSYEICRTLQASGLSHLVDAYNHMRMGLLPGLPNHLQELTDLCVLVYFAAEISATNTMDMRRMSARSTMTHTTKTTINSRMSTLL